MSFQFDSAFLVVELLTEYEKADAFDFMRSLGLSPNCNYDFLLGIKIDGKIVATGAAFGSVVKFLAVNPSFQGEGLASKIVTAVIDRLAEASIHHQFIYTKPSVAPLLLDMGFSLISQIDNDDLGHVALLEGGIGSISSWCKSLDRLPNSVKSPALVVVNCNPLTNGHLHLLKTAHANEKALHIFVVSTEESLFPANVRFNLVKEAVKDWENTIVHKAGDYMVSMATFPSYFTREEDVAKMQACLDIQVFCSHIVPALSIGSRYVGHEPYCPVTSLYNDAMKFLLPKHNVKFVEVPRIESSNIAISASQVRKLLKEGVLPHELGDLIPESTKVFLNTNEGMKIIEKIKGSSSRH